jgi:hypothetical protein
MSERGVFAVDRGVWDHHLFASHDPLTRREAWLWLISEASWKPRVKRIGAAVIELARGQLAHSIRFVAEAWRWPKSNVARFLAALKTEAMIGTETVHGLTVVTICNYDEYQRVSLPDRDTNRDTERDKFGTAAGQQRDKLEDNKNIEDIEGTSLRSVAVLAAAKPKRAKARGQMPDDWHLDQQDFDHANERGFLPAKIQEMSAAFANHHRAKGTLMADWHAAWRKWCGNEIKFNGKGQNHGRRTVHDAANDLIAKINALDEPAPGSLRGGTSEGAVRLLPPR